MQGFFSSPACSGEDAYAKVFLELLQEDEGEHRVWDQADACRNKTLSMEIFGINPCMVFGPVGPVARFFLKKNVSSFFPPKIHCLLAHFLIITDFLFFLIIFYLKNELHINAV